MLEVFSIGEQGITSPAVREAVPGHNVASFSFTSGAHVEIISRPIIDGVTYEVIAFIDESIKFFLHLVILFGLLII